MTRRIVQIASSQIQMAAGEFAERLYALDNNGVAWMMDEPRTNAAWHRLPALPSVENPRPARVFEDAE